MRSCRSPLVSGRRRDAQPRRPWRLLADGFHRMVRFLIITGDPRTPRLRANGFIGLPDHVELAVAFNFSPIITGLCRWWLVASMVRGKSGRRVEGLPGHRLAYFVNIGGARFGHRLRPYAGPPGRFHRIVGHHRIGIRQLVRFGIRAIIGDEGFVGRIIDGLKVVPCREVADQRFGIDAAQLLFPTEKATTGTSVAFRPRLASSL